MGALTLAEKKNSAVGKGINLLTADRPSKDFVSTHSIIDISKVDIETMTEKGMNIEVLTENSQFDLANSISISASVEAKLMGFSASVTTKYESSKNSSEEKAYTRVRTVIKKRREFLKSDAAFKKNLDPEFNAALNGSMAPAALFNRYGTHIIKHAGIGGALTMYLTTYKKTNESKDSLQAEISAGYKGIASAKTSTTIKNEIKDLLSRSHYTSDPDGGKSIPSLTIDNFFTEYPSWVTSVDSMPSSWEFSYLPAADALEPIWNLTSNKARKTQLENYYNDEVAKIKDSLTKLDVYVGEIQIVSSKSQTTAMAKSSGWKVIDLDLNERAGGRFIYVHYRTGTRNQIAKWYSSNERPQAWDGKPITNLLMVWYKKKQTWTTKNITDSYGRSAKYHRIDVDLNEGAGGLYIYLCYTTDKPERFHELTAISGYSGGSDEEKAILSSNEWGRVTWSDQNIAADANKGISKSSYVYLVQKHK